MSIKRVINDVVRSAFVFALSFIPVELWRQFDSNSYVVNGVKHSPWYLLAAWPIYAGIGISLLLLPVPVSISRFFYKLVLVVVWFIIVWAFHITLSGHYHGHYASINFDLNTGRRILFNREECIADCVSYSLIVSGVWIALIWRRLAIAFKTHNGYRLSIADVLYVITYLSVCFWMIVGLIRLFLSTEPGY